MNIKKAVLVLFRLCVNSDYRKLRALKVFDSGYYLSLQGKASEDDLDPLWTYVKTGETCANRIVGGTITWSQQADPHPLFDTDFYVSQYFPQGIDENPFLHYLRLGWKKGYKPGPFFDPRTYWRNIDEKSNVGNPLIHYCHYGQKQGESPSLNFDFAYYFDKNPVLSGVRYEIIKHYKLHGAFFCKSPLPVFDPQFYTGQLGSEHSKVFDPLSHYLATAEDTTYLPAKLFDPDFYRQECGVELTRGEALTHYVTQGVFDGVYCHPRVAALPSTPLISILVPVYNPDLGVLRNCIRSVLYQAYPHWELCLADDCSPDADVRNLLEEWAKKDSRIKVAFLTKNGGIARATNEAEKLASGTYLGFLDNDDELTVDCLLEVVDVIHKQNGDLVYSDEDLIGDDSSTLSVFRKPAFNLGLLFSHNYITHFVTVKRSLFTKVGGLDSACDGAQDYDLMLKLSEVCENIVHIPKVLYHWRASESSTSINHGQKNYANEAGRRALEAAVRRRGLVHEVVGTELNFFYHLSCPENPTTEVTVIVWAVKSDGCLPEFLTHLSNGCGGADVEYIVAVDEKSCELINFEDSGLKCCQVAPVGGNETKAAVMDRLIRASAREVIVFLDGNTQQLSEEWLTELYSPLCRPSVALACGRTTYNGGDGKSYLLPDLTNKSAAYLQAFLTSTTQHMAGLHCPQDVSYGSWDIAMLRKEDYEAVGGFRFAEFSDMFAMADLSIRLGAHGKIITYTPFAVQDKEVRAVPASTGEDEARQRVEEKRRFQHVLQKHEDTVDPFYNQEILTDNGIDEASFRKWLFSIG